MTFQQILLFALFAALLGMLLWGRYRYDLVAAGGLLIAVALGLVPEGDAFSGFSNPAVIVVALVLVVSRAFENSGVLGFLAQWMTSAKRPTGAHIATLGGLGAALSGVINNVAALALLMPLDIRAARQAGRPPGATLMPLAFATILGGMVTLIGTPPNIIASSIRAEKLGAPYGMFDFTPVGLAVAAAGLLFVALVGWRLIPMREDKTAALEVSSFTAALVVPEDSGAAGKFGLELDGEFARADALLIGVHRNGDARATSPRYSKIDAGDTIVVEGSTEAIAAIIKSLGLQEAETEDDSRASRTVRPAAAERPGDGQDEKARKPAVPEIIEVVVRANSPLAGRTAAGFGLRERHGVTLLGTARSGVFAREEIRRRPIEAGDVLLLSGEGASSERTLAGLGLIPLTRTSVSEVKVATLAITVGLFAAAILAATFGLLSFTVAIAIAVAAYAALGIVPAREFYDQIEWPIVVMLACLIPIGAAFERVGGSALVAQGLASALDGYSPIVALIAMMTVTMMLSDVLNNVATIVVTGPIAIDLAQRLDANPDTFLMATAIAASCAFLTPIGHKNNTLIMGPGSFRFSDYWPMGLPLEIVVLCVSVPMLMLVWPL